jgi:hypothetical protein
MAILIQDSFTDTEGTLLGGHTGEDNASWLSNANFGSGLGDANEFIIKSNKVRRVNFDDPEGFPSGTAIAYSATSADVDAALHFDLSMDLTFEAGVITSFMGIYYNAQDTFGSPVLLAEFGNTYVDVIIDGATAFAFTEGVTYAVRVSRRGNNVMVFVDDLMIAAVAGVDPVGKIGMSMFDHSAVSKVTVDNWSMQSIDGIAYYDQFNGSGSLDGYTSDSGHSYVEISGNPLVSLLRNSGHLTGDSSVNTRSTFSTAVLPAGKAKLEFLASRQSNASTSVWSVKMLLVQPDATDITSGDRFGASFRFLGGTTELWVYNGDGTFTQDVNELAGTPSPLTNVLSHIVVDYDTDSSEIVVTFNGAEVHRAVIPALDTEGWKPAVEIRIDAADNVRMYHALASVASPFTPEAFWTQRLRTTEII